MTGDCPICGGAISSRDAPLLVKDGYPIARCRTCGLLYRADPPGDDELPGLYGEDYFTASAGELGAQGYADYLRDEPNHRATARARLRVLARYGAPGRLLDVGCAAGFFADEARIAGWESEGVDLSPAMAPRARELGVLVHEASFADLQLPVRSFDAVTMWDYIEHSTDPVRDLRAAASVLRPDGVLVLSTGDAASLVARLSGRRWHLLTPRHHNFFFTPAAIRTALDRAGLRLLSVKHPGGRYSVAHLSHKLGLGVGGAPGRVSVPVNLFDIMTVVAQAPGKTVASDDA